MGAAVDEMRRRMMMEKKKKKRRRRRVAGWWTDLQGVQGAGCTDPSGADDRRGATNAQSAGYPVILAFLHSCIPAFLAQHLVRKERVCVWYKEQACKNTSMQACKHAWVDWVDWVVWFEPGFHPSRDIQQETDDACLGPLQPQPSAISHQPSATTPHWQAIS